MTYQFNCPKCRHHLYFPGFDDLDDDLVDTTCDRCHYKYGVVAARVVSFNLQLSRIDSLYQGWMNSSWRWYKLRVIKPSGKTESVEFVTRGFLPKIGATSGDRLLLLYAMRSSTTIGLIQVRNLTTGGSCVLADPDERAMRAGLKTIAVVFGALSFLGMFVQFNNRLAVAIVAIPTTTVAAGMVYRQREPKTAMAERSRLSFERGLLEQKYQLEQKIDLLAMEEAECSQAIARFQKLQARMSASAEADLYVSRQQIMSKGSNLLAAQFDSIQKLADGYRMSMDMLAIEYETSRLAEQLPNDLGDRLLSKLEELKALEVQKEELALQINPQAWLN